MPARPGELIANEQLRSLNEAIQSNILAKTCIRYLDCKAVWEDIQQQERVDSVIQAFREYAANSWHKHVKQGIVNSEEVVQLINTFFYPANENWESWRKYSENALQNQMIQYEGELSLGNPLFYASLLGLSKTVTHFVEEVGLDVNCVDSSNRTALLAASSKGWVLGVIQLLQKGASVNIASDEGRTPIYAGASQGYVEVVKLLLEKGADLTVTNKNGWTPLICAANSGHDKIVSLLLAQQNVDPQSSDANGRTALSWAASKGHETVIELLIADERLDGNSQDHAGLTPLMWAARKSQDSTVNFLVQHGCSMHGSDRHSFFFQIAMFMTHKAFEMVATVMHFEIDDFTLGLVGLFEEIEYWDH
ncbi:ankyrin repeat-containing domain protein [Xylaria digitata]|nr:ankyrin repeat-containing domain protein [Xylaria digitata]